jgi:hypothetical protein
MADAKGPPRRNRGPAYDPTEDTPVASYIPFNNPPACVAYVCGLVGLIPVFGLVLGPLACLFGVFGLRKLRHDPSLRGRGHSLIVGVWLGSAEFVINVVGLALIYKGWDEL